MKAVPMEETKWALQSFNLQAKEWVTKREYADVGSAMRDLKTALKNRVSGARRVFVRIKEIQASPL